MKVFTKLSDRFKAVAVLLSSISTAAGCGGAVVPDAQNPVAVSSTACSPGVAQILIGDGFLKPVCGCVGAGESGTVYPVPGNMSCHLATSTTQVFFSLWGTLLPHQIVSPAGIFLATPLMDPKSTSVISSFAISFPTPATTYGFQEVYTGMVGQIIVP